MKEYFVQENQQDFTQFIFPTVQAAIDALPDNQEWYCIKISPGSYREKISLRRSYTILEGLGETASDTLLWYDDFAYDTMADGSKRGTFRSYSFLLDANKVTLRNLTISNCSGDENQVGQAIALYADGDELLIENCRLTGRQDTLFTGPLPPKEIQPGGFIGPKQFAPRINGHHLYRNCYICGNIDFIFGSATAYFEHCTIESLSHALASPVQGYIAAPSTPEGQAYGYVFDSCLFISKECPPETVYLARPWRDYGQAVFLHCSMGAHIRLEGFHDWGKKLAAENAFFAVLDCISSEASAYEPTASFASQLTQQQLHQYDKDKVLSM